MHGKNYYLAATCATCKFCCRTFRPDDDCKYFCRHGEALFDPPKPPHVPLDAPVTLAYAQEYEKDLLAWEGKTEVEAYGICDAFEYRMPGESA